MRTVTTTGESGEPSAHFVSFQEDGLRLGCALSRNAHDALARAEHFRHAPRDVVEQCANGGEALVACACAVAAALLEGAKEFDDTIEGQVLDAQAS